MIFISAGHNDKDPGAVANGTTEATLTKELRDLTIRELKARGARFVQDKDSESLGQYLTRIDTGSGSVVLEYHFNAGPPSATGVEVLVPNNPSADTKELAAKICKVIADACGIKNRGVKTESESARGSLGLMREKGIVVLPEVCFISNAGDLARYNGNKAYIAKSIADLLIEAEALHL